MYRRILCLTDGDCGVPYDTAFHDVKVIANEISLDYT